MSAWDIDESLIALRSAFLGDSEITDLLGGAEEIYRERPRVKPTFPALTIIVDSDNPQTQFDGVGAWAPSLEIGVMASAKSTCREIIGILDKNWTIPERNQTRIESANLAISSLRRTGSVTVGEVQLQNDDGEIYLINSLWIARIQPL